MRNQVIKEAPVRSEHENERMTLAIVPTSKNFRMSKNVYYRQLGAHIYCTEERNYFSLIL